MKNFIKSLELRRSDLFLLLGFLPFTIFLIFGQLFMQYSDPSEVALPLWAGIICFVISICSWGYYLYLEFNKEHNEPKRIISYIFLVLGVLGFITCFIQPSNITNDVFCRQVNGSNLELYPGIEVNDLIRVTTPLSITHKIFFAMDITLILMFIYIGLFIFPKRLKGILFIKYLGYALFIFLIVLIGYSYISEANNYIPFIKCLMSGDMTNITTYAMKSFIIHRNAYGMALMLGIIFCFINHSIDKKWWYYLLIVFFFINMLFSWCKTGILISILITMIYVIYRLIVTIKEHKKRNIIILSILGGIVLLGLLMVTVSYISKGKILGFIYNIISGSKEGGTLDMRVYIWDNCFILLRNGWWLIGRGFGLFNVALYDMNKVNGDFVFPSHNGFLCLLTEGGILYLLAYLLLIAYSIKIFIEDYKKNPGLAVAMMLGVLAFFIYSFIEAIQYLVYVFLFPLYVLHNYESKEIKH